MYELWVIPAMAWREYSYGKSFWASVNSLAENQQWVWRHSLEEVLPSTSSAHPWTLVTTGLRVRELWRSWISSCPKVMPFSPCSVVGKQPKPELRGWSALPQLVRRHCVDWKEHVKDKQSFHKSFCINVECFVLCTFNPHACLHKYFLMGMLTSCPQGFLIFFVIFVGSGWWKSRNRYRKKGDRRKREESPSMVSEMKQRGNTVTSLYTWSQRIKN